MSLDLFADVQRVLIIICLLFLLNVRAVKPISCHFLLQYRVSRKRILNWCHMTACTTRKIFMIYQWWKLKLKMMTMWEFIMAVRCLSDIYCVELKTIFQALDVSRNKKKTKTETFKKWNVFENASELAQLREKWTFKNLKFCNLVPEG